MIKSWKKVFENATDGCLWAFRTQKNFKIHFLVSLAVLFLAWWLKISLEKFFILILAIVLGLTVEMANTAFEKTVDLITEEYNTKAKIVKDISAGMMLVLSIGLAVLGMLILLPPLWQKLLSLK